MRTLSENRKGEGHASLEASIPAWARTQDAQIRKPLSMTGSQVMEKGYAWHPADTPLKERHQPTPDLSSGGKARPSIAKKIIDKTYNVDAALQKIAPR